MNISDPDSFMAILLEVLQLHPEGLREYDLLQHLRSDERVDLDGSRLDDSHDLFRTHFLLFHHLHRLRDQLRANGRGDIEIHTLSIRLHPLMENRAQALARPDPLRTYYLDLNNLEGTTREDVVKLLTAFWSRFGRYDRRHEALAILEMPDDADIDSIRKQYRRLAMRHHPDRGGDAGRLQAINAAMAILDPRKD